MVLAEIAVRDRCLPEAVNSFDLDVEAFAPDHRVEAIERPPRRQPVESDQLEPLGCARFPGLSLMEEERRALAAMRAGRKRLSIRALLIPAAAT